ncbi:hypothetical protein PIB30_077786 [Stylosanthes scabra]|uniref:Uncharacterized protein n=1 Tax=Stylosanthes scabra TaxID=79078 RepID=A0ABU6SQS1_9FABA|nr:hypothetical protein [Stylosanthes scabra]
MGPRQQCSNNVPRFPMMKKLHISFHHRQPLDVPAPSAPSSPEPSRKDLMRALRRNECIMQISQNPQNQRAGSAEKENAEEDDDFQSAEATGDASTYAGEESTDDK